MPAIPGRPSKGKKGDRVVLEVVIGDGRATTSTPSESDPDYVAQVVLNNVTATHDSLDAEVTQANLKFEIAMRSKFYLPWLTFDVVRLKKKLLLSVFQPSSSKKY